MRTCVVVNPQSSNGKTGRGWPAIEKKLEAVSGNVEARFTDAPMAAQRLTAEALREGAERIVAVGGDGTINEVVNGFFADGALINPDAELAVLTSGTGGDFKRTFDYPAEMDAQIARIAAGKVRVVDLGKLTFEDHEGKRTVRYFDNIASFGLSGTTDMAVNALSFGKRWGGKLAYKWAMLKALLTYRNQLVRVQVDDTFDEVVNVSIVAVCNGRYFGGSMHMAPDARPDDGLFDVIMVADVNNLQLVLKSGSIYKGEHLDFDEVTAVRGKKVTATPVEGAAHVFLDVDGEAPGRLPASFEIVPGALRLVC